MRLRIRESALDDLADGRIFDERQGGKALGEYFFNSVFADIDSLILYHGIHGKVGDYHRVLARRFPYAVYYKMGEDAVEVCRVLDCRQDPDEIRERLK
ncbi:MAG: type II toxin-antitoxin system RelE/ParE family toxin [Verrucomicrobiota bacterium]